MTYWFVRNLDGEIISVTNSSILWITYERPSGPQYACVMKTENHPDYYIYSEIDIDKQTGVRSYKPHHIVEEISQIQYDTYKEFGL